MIFKELWMQRRGLEWLFRLLQGLYRLWRRYFWTNSAFVFLLIKELLRPDARGFSCIL